MHRSPLPGGKGGGSRAQRTKNRAARHQHTLSPHYRSCESTPHPSSPSRGLRDSRKCRIRCDDDSRDGRGEALPAFGDGLWTGWFIVAVPPAVASDDPGEPSEGACWMRIFLLCGGAFAGLDEDRDGALELWIEDIAHGPLAAVAGVDELDDPHGGAEGQGREMEQAFAVLDLGFLKRKAIAFEGAEDLFDAPSQSIEANDLAGVVGAADGQGRHDAPEQWLDPAGGILLDRLHEPELQ